MKYVNINDFSDKIIIEKGTYRNGAPYLQLYESHSKGKNKFPLPKIDLEYLAEFIRILEYEMDIRRCPRCKEFNLRIGMEQGYYHLECKTCGTSTPLKLSVEEAIKYWNSNKKLIKPLLV